MSTSPPPPPPFAAGTSRVDPERFAAFSLRDVERHQDVDVNIALKEYGKLVVPIYQLKSVREGTVLEALKPTHRLAYRVQRFTPDQKDEFCFGLIGKGLLDGKVCVKKNCQVARHRNRKVGRYFPWDFWVTVNKDDVIVRKVEPFMVHDEESLVWKEFSGDYLCPDGWEEVKELVHCCQVTHIEDRERWFRSC